MKHATKIVIAFGAFGASEAFIFFSFRDFSEVEHYVLKFIYLLSSKWTC